MAVKDVVFREAVLDEALKLVGVRETTENWGPEVAKFLKSANVNVPAPWCAAFVNYCGELAAKALSILSPLEQVCYQASVQAYVDYGRAHGWQVKFATEVEPGDIFCLYFPSMKRFGHIGLVVKKHADGVHFDTVEGNGLPVTAPVLTPTGWQEIGRLKVGDQICDPYNDFSVVTGVYPQGKREVYKITFSDGSSVIADGQHRWKVLRGNRKVKQEEVLTTLQLLEHKKRYKQRLYLPKTPPTELPAKDLPLDPYLLGLLLGDGGLSRQSAVRFTSADPDLLAAVEELIPVGCALKQVAGIDHRVTGTPLHGALDAMGLQVTSERKFIPPEYLWGSVAQRLALLQGLMDTDGSIDKSGRVEYCTVSPQLAADVQFLVQSLGGKVRVYVKRNVHYTAPNCPVKKKAKDAYVLRNIRFPAESGICPFRLAWKKERMLYKRKPESPCGWAIVSVEPCGIEETVCISVSALSKLYFTSNFIPTHNTNDDGSREGYEVACRVRANTNNVIFLRYDKGVVGKAVEPEVVTPAPVAPDIIKG